MKVYIYVCLHTGLSSSALSKEKPSFLLSLLICHKWNKLQPPVHTAQAAGIQYITKLLAPPVFIRSADKFSRCDLKLILLRKLCRSKHKEELKRNLSTFITAYLLVSCVFLVCFQLFYLHCATNYLYNSSVAVECNTLCSDLKLTHTLSRPPSEQVSALCVVKRFIGVCCRSTTLVLFLQNNHSALSTRWIRGTVSLQRAIFLSMGVLLWGGGGGRLLPFSSPSRTRAACGM